MGWRLHRVCHARPIQRSFRWGVAGRGRSASTRDASPRARRGSIDRCAGSAQVCELALQTEESREGESHAAVSTKGEHPMAHGARDRRRTAFVLAGGGSLGAVEVGMLRALLEGGERADLVVGSSVGALNAAYFAGSPTIAGVAGLEAIWRSLRRDDVFPLSPRYALAGLAGRRDHLVSPLPLRALIERSLPYRDLREAKLPCCVVATDLAQGSEVRLDRGPAVEALLASAAVPGVFPPVALSGRLLVDGGVLSHTPIAAAVALGATRIVVLPTGYPCAPEGTPPPTPLGVALHALSLLIARQLVSDIERFSPAVELRVVPPLCPLRGAIYDFAQVGSWIDRAYASTREWLRTGGLTRLETPHALMPHPHEAVP
jgi:NTE family protein